MNLKKIALVGAMTAVLVGYGGASAFAATATATPIASTHPTTTASTCLPGGHDDVWPAWTNDRPGRDPGVTIWHDGNGWHVRLTHNTIRDRVFSGEIQTTGMLTNVSAVRLERNDYLTVGSGGHALRFRFNNYGGTDGFDFTTHCAPYLEFGFVTDGHVLSTAHISIGAAAHHPAQDPFVIRRTA
jgi:hypothetical protein